MDLSAYPERLPAPPSPKRGDGQGALTYVLDPSRVAFRGRPPSSADPRTAVVLGPDLTVVPVTGIPPGAAATALLPVYTLGDGDAPFVPTGSVSLRFRDGVPAREREDRLHDLGYRILDVPAYAPHFAWIEAESGRVSDTLAGFKVLQGVPDVAHVEVQMTTRKAAR